MIYLPLEMLRPNMVLARNIPSPNPRLPLIRAGQRLTEGHLAQFAYHKLKGAYVENELSDDIEVEPFIAPETKQKLLVDIKSELDKCRTSHGTPNFQNISNMASSLVMCVLGQNNNLYNIIEIRNYDSYTYSHSLYVATLGVLLGTKLRLPKAKLTELAEAGLLHDIGKLDIPLTIINKPGALTGEEYNIIKKHPENAIKRLRGCSSYQPATLSGIATHHESFDGTGYPWGLAGDDIPVLGRILAIADVYDALSANRSYRDAWQPGEIIEYMMSRSGSQFDPDILPNFLQSVAAFPDGTLVELSDGRIGIVLENHSSFPLRPTIRILYPFERRLSTVDLSKEQLNVTIIKNYTGDDADLSKIGLFGA